MIYFVQDISTGDIKIGHTDGEAKNRISSLQTGNQNKLRVLCTFDGSKNIERLLHDEFAHLHIHGEWFRGTDELIDFASFMRTAPTQSWTNAWMEDPDGPGYNALRKIQNGLGQIRKQPTLQKGYDVSIRLAVGVAPQRSYVGSVQAVDETGIRICLVKLPSNGAAGGWDLFVPWKNIESCLVCSPHYDRQDFLAPALDWQIDSKPSN